MSQARNPGNASPGTQLVGDSLAVTDAQLAAILVVIKSTTLTSQKVTATLTSTISNLPSPPASNPADTFLFPGWAQARATQAKAAQGVGVRGKGIQRLTQVEERERAWLAERMNQREGERAQRVLKR